MTPALTTIAMGPGPLADLHLQVVGGKQRRPAGMRELDGSWYGYGSGLLVDVTNGEPTPRLEHFSEPGTCGPDDPILFKSASVVDGMLYACSQTEVMVYSYPDLERVHYFSHPYLNDVHHVIPTGPNTVAVAVSGHDAVMEFTLAGDLKQVWGLDDRDPSDRLDPTTDYRTNCDLKPHIVHPNYVFMLGDELWTTRFELRDAVAVADLDRRIAIDRERCHDGVVHGDRVYFTSVDGFVIEADPTTLAVVAEHPLAAHGSETLLGWCRGLTFVDDLALVGFSRIRHTKFRGALSWVRNKMTASEPTRIVAYRLPDWEMVGQVDLEPAGLNAVFSILLPDGEA